MPRLLLAAVVLAILAQCASARTRAAPSPIASPGRFDDDYDEDDGFDLDEDAFVFVADEEENNDAVAAARERRRSFQSPGSSRSCPTRWSR